MSGFKGWKRAAGLLAMVTMAGGCGPELGDEGMDAVGEAGQPLAGYCYFKVKVTGVRATDGQGVFEGNLEVRLTATAASDSAVLPGPTLSPYSLNPDPDAPWQALDADITTVAVAVGSTKSVPVDVSVLEEDSGTLGKDDYGSRTATFSLACDGTARVLTPDVSLYREEMGSYNGIVEVRLRAEPQ